MVGANRMDAGTKNEYKCLFVPSKELLFFMNIDNIEYLYHIGLPRGGIRTFCRFVKYSR